ncbi:hypothetical protein J2128_000420 [Methanomicrobium sp. W14]|nr:hypothetical protein [Methanomicrobium sp. W14]MBP2132499.1 hypothetical protein [Methanomicrobium sp. W14]
MLITSNGRRKREETLNEIQQSDVWSVEDETQNFPRCRLKYNSH